MLSPQQIAEASKRLGAPAKSTTTAAKQQSWDSISFPGENKTQPAAVKKPSFFESLGGLVNKGAEELGSIADKYGMGKQGLASSALQTAGTAAGTLTDIGMEAAKRITPSFIKEPVKAGIKAIAETKSAQDVIKAYSDWANKHPEAAANLEATVNLATVLPGAKVGEAGTKAAATAAKTAGKALKESGANKLASQISEHALKLVKPMETKATKIADVARTTEKGLGLFKRSIIAPSAKESLMAKAVEKVPGIHPEKTFQQNYNIISGYSKKLASNLKSEISSYKVAIPKQEMMSKLTKASEKLAESPLITGDAEKMAKKMLEGAKKFINQNPGTAEGLFQARKDFDAWVKSQKPTIFDAKTEGALTIANREIRNSFTDLLDKKIPNVGLKEKLMNQHHLLDAVENIAPKAAEEANWAIGRAFQKAKNIIGTRNETFNTAAAALGLGGIAAGSAAFAGPAAAIGVPSILIYKGTRAILKPEVRTAIGKVLSEIGKKLETVTSPVEIKALTEANNELKKYLKISEK